MKLGAILVLVGVILVVIDFALGHVPRGEAGRGYNNTGLLHAGVLLIGIGVLVGSTKLTT